MDLRPNPSGHGLFTRRDRTDMDGLECARMLLVVLGRSEHF